MMKSSSVLFILLVVSSAVTARAQSPTTPVGAPTLETYRREFAMCDADDRFESVQFPIFNAQGKLVWRGCGDHSNLVRLETFAAKDSSPAAILFEAKLAWDDDGSKQSCSAAHRSTSQCETSLKLKASPGAACADVLRGKTYCVPTDPDLVPFIVIPGDGPSRLDAHEFSHRTGIGVGDYAVVIYHTRAVAAILADEGPANKIGEGSTLLLKSLSGGGPTTRDAGVIYIAFPGTADAVDSLRLETLAGVVSHKGCSLYAALVGREGAKDCH